MKLGLENFLTNKKLLKYLKNKSVGLVCHPASVNSDLTHSLDLISKKTKLTCAFGPQHGVRGDKQDNMIETEDFIDPHLQIPIYSLYGSVRRPTFEMMGKFDVLLFDLQDIGCRIYTFATTLLYVMEECTKHGKELIILDRPNPAGRPVEGFSLQPGWESFVGAAPIPMRHGLTVGELALYFKNTFKLDLKLSVMKMTGYSPDKSPGFGWPSDRAWVNPSPNASNMNMARAFPGTVLIEGTHLSEGRGTTRPLEIIGAPDIDFKKVFSLMKKKAPQWLKGAQFRECFFEPTFQKHKGKLCGGIQIHTDSPKYKHGEFRPFRVVAILLKSIKELYPTYEIYRDFPYEYVIDKLAFDVLNGGPLLREWIDNPRSTVSQLDSALKKDEKSWLQARKKFLLY